MNTPQGAPGHARPKTYQDIRDQCMLGSNKLRNLAYANGLMKDLGRSGADEAAVDLKDDDANRAYMDRAGGANFNRKSARRALVRMLGDLPEETFKEALSRALAKWRSTGGTRASLVEATGIRPEYFRTDATKLHSLPGELQRTALQSVERLCGLASGSLTRFINNWDTRGFNWTLQFDLRNPFYDWKYKVENGRQFGRRLLIHTNLLAQHKTEMDCWLLLPDGSVKELRRRKAWTASPKGVSTGLPAQFTNWASFPSAVIALQQTGIPSAAARAKHGDAADTLAVVLDADAVKKWIIRDMKLRKGIYHSGYQTMLEQCKSLIDPDTGFIAQLPELFLEDARALGLDVDVAGWREFIVRQHAALQAIPATLQPNRLPGRRAQRARDSKLKLREILNHEDAYGAIVLPTILHMEASRPPRFAPRLVRLDYEVSLLRVTLFAAAPSRLQNWTIAEWDKHLRRKDDGWWFEIPKEELKNRRFQEQNVIIKLPDWASRIVDQYCDCIRPEMATSNPLASLYVMAGPLVRRQTAEAFVAGEGLRDVHNSIYASVKGCFTKVMKQLWNVPISPHDWRHIFATDYLNQFPGDVLTVAMMLGDKPATIIREYGTPDSARLSRLAARAMDEKYREAAGKTRRAIQRPASGGKRP